MLRRPGSAVGSPCFSWHKIQVFLFVAAEHGEMFLPETTNERWCGTEYLQPTNHLCEEFV